MCLTVDMVVCTQSDTMWSQVFVDSHISRVLSVTYGVKIPIRRIVNYDISTMCITTPLYPLLF